MLHRAFRAIGFMTLMSTPVASQFGVPKGRKGASFEELNRMAKDQFSRSNDMAKMEGLDNFNIEDMQKVIAEAMKDPTMMDAMNGVSANVEQAMEQISKMSPEQLMNKMAEGLQMLSTTDIMEAISSQKDEVLATLVDQGLVDDDTLEEYEKNPAKFEQDMKHAFDEMKDIFSDPEALSAAAQMMKGFTDIFSNPDQAMQEFASIFANDLNDNDKIEEARLQLLENPDKAGSSDLAAMFEDEDMKRILNDPKKWREQVKKGQEVLLSGVGAGGSRGAGIGEL